MTKSRYALFVGIVLAGLFALVLVMRPQWAKRAAATGREPTPPGQPVPAGQEADARASEPAPSTIDARPAEVEPERIPETTPVILRWSTLWPVIEGGPGRGLTELRALTSQVRPRFLLRPGQPLDPFVQHAAYGLAELTLDTLAKNTLRAMDQSMLTLVSLRPMFSSQPNPQLRLVSTPETFAYEQDLANDGISTTWEVRVDWQRIAVLLATLAEVVSSRCEVILVRCAEAKAQAEAGRPADERDTVYTPIPKWQRPRIAKAWGELSLRPLADGVIADAFKFPEACREVVTNLTGVVSVDSLNCR